MNLVIPLLEDFVIYCPSRMLYKLTGSSQLLKVFGWFWCLAVLDSMLVEFNISFSLSCRFIKFYNTVDMILFPYRGSSSVFPFVDTEKCNRNLCI